MNTHALRYYPFETSADSIIREIIAKNERDIADKPYSQYDVYRKISIDGVFHAEFWENQIRDVEKKNDPVYRHIIKPYLPWLQYASPQKENAKYRELTTALYEDYFTYYSNHIKKKEGYLLRASKKYSLYGIFGDENLNSSLNDVLGNVNLFKTKNDALFHSLPGPLNEESLGFYRYFFSDRKTENGEVLHEIAFYPENPQSFGLEGFLYVTATDCPVLKKAVFSVALPVSNNFIRDLLFVQLFDVKENSLVPVEEKTCFVLGDDIQACLLVARTVCYTGFLYPESMEKSILKTRKEKDYLSKNETFWESRRPIPLTEAELQVRNLVKASIQTQAFLNTENFLHLLLTEYWTIGGKGGFFEWGKLSQAISYNEMEGLRLKFGGNTTTYLNKRLLLGGYVAYGLKDKQFKYRGDIRYSFLPKENSIWEYPNSLLSISYVNDLNVLGYDLLTSDRDNIFYSVPFTPFNNMMRQKLGVIAFEQEISGYFSFKLEGKYLHDKPEGKIQYKPITTSELNFSFRYAPREKFIQNREKRVFFRRGSVELNLKHRIGLKGIFGSQYNYHITNGDIYKKIYLPQNIGSIDVDISAGKVWNRLPYPLLLIFYGKDSYIFDEKNYNLMNFHEFVTDNFVAGNMNFLFNWSPLRLFASQNKIKTSLGGRILYGPLSERNNPDLHPELIPLGQGVYPLGKNPYIEINFGFANIFKIFRIEYIRRLTYLKNENTNKGSLFVTVDLAF
jgi:hypothetical protein